MTRRKITYRFQLKNFINIFRRKINRWKKRIEYHSIQCKSRISKLFICRIDLITIRAFKLNLQPTKLFFYRLIDKFCFHFWKIILFSLLYMFPWTISILLCITSLNGHLFLFLAFFTASLTYSEISISNQAPSRSRWIEIHRIIETLEGKKIENG